MKKKQRRLEQRVKKLEKKKEVTNPTTGEDWKACIFGSIFVMGLLILQEVLLK